MAATVWDQIMANIVAVLGTITKANLFNHDLGPDGIGVWRPTWSKNWPEVNIADGIENLEDFKRTDVIYAARLVEIEMVDSVSISPGALEVSEKIESMRADIFKAMFTDHTQGGVAMDTDYVSSAPVVYSDANDLIGVAVVFSVRYRFIYNDLTQNV